MSGTTTNLALRYPTSGDNIAPLETHFKNLADDVDAAHPVPFYRVGATAEALDSVAVTNTETAIGSVTFAQVSGKTYETRWNLKVVASVASDRFVFTVRQDSVGGASLDAWAFSVGAASSGEMKTFQIDYPAGATGSKTLVGTLQRLSGTGNIVRAAKSNYAVYKAS